MRESSSLRFFRWLFVGSRIIGAIRRNRLRIAVWTAGVGGGGGSVTAAGGGRSTAAMFRTSWVVSSPAEEYQRKVPPGHRD
jgi:hypothetical protein